MTRRCPDHGTPLVLQNGRWVCRRCDAEDDDGDDPLQLFNSERGVGQ